MKRVIVALAALAILVLAPRAHAQEYVVVVNAANPVSELTKDAASKIFLKRQVKWANGSDIVPVDLGKSSPVRDAFSRAVHGRPASAILAHWQQQIFSGRDVPPSEQGSDSDAIAFVRSHPNAIAYVSAGTTLGNGVKAVAIR